MGARRSFDNLSDVVEAVNAAESIDQALASLASHIDAGHEVATVTAARYEDHSVVLVSVWQALPVQTWEPGMAISLDLTPGVRDAADRVLAGRPVAARIDEPDLGLLTDLSRAEGVRSWIAVPLHDGDEVVAAIFMGSAGSEGFTDDDLPFFAGVGRGVEEHLVRLVRKSGR